MRLEYKELPCLNQSFSSMDDIGRHAQELGMTPGLLDSLLRDK